VQAKTDAFASKDMMNDFMELTVQFALVTCFSVVLPVLTVLALISNLVEFRLIAWRQCFVVQRTHPEGAEGIGINLGNSIELAECRRNWILMH
jgi:hypothetical protein